MISKFVRPCYGVAVLSSYNSSTPQILMENQVFSLPVMVPEPNLLITIFSFLTTAVICIIFTNHGCPMTFSEILNSLANSEAKPCLHIQLVASLPTFFNDKYTYTDRFVI